MFLKHLANLLAGAVTAGVVWAIMKYVMKIDISLDTVMILATTYTIQAHLLDVHRDYDEVKLQLYAILFRIGMPSRF